MAHNHEQITPSANLVRNKHHYDSKLRAVPIDSIVERVLDLEAFLDDATRTDTSWVALYRENFRQRLTGVRVLELGSGDGLNSLVMAAAGADVVSIDISNVASDLLSAAAVRLKLDAHVRAISGDFSQLPLPLSNFDFVVGKGFLHHLTHEVERAYLQKMATLLKPTGEARFAEPAVNSRVLDTLRWIVPVPGRPSVLAAGAFQRYRALDPHPPRDNSSAHYIREAGRYFASVTTAPLGSIERFHRLMPTGTFNRSFRRFAFRAETYLPPLMRERLARAQLIVCRSPRPLAESTSPVDAKS